MANGQPRSELRKHWAVPEHLAALDDDQDKLQAALEQGFQKIADQLERNRRTWQWSAMFALGILGIIVPMILVLVNAGGK